MIKTFPVEYKHCVLLGVLRKLFRLWLTRCHQTGKKFNYRFRISNRQKYILNERLFILQKYIPNEFSRKSRDLYEFDKWKVT